MSKPSFLNKTKKKICLICEGFELIRTKINNIFGNSVAADKVIIFVNPCTMQVILSHFGDVILRTQNKRKNDSEIKRLTGLTDSKKYDGCKEHRDFIFSQITKENYEEMKNRISLLSDNYKNQPATNFAYYLELFENYNSDWIDKINSILEKEE